MSGNKSIWTDIRLKKMKDATEAYIEKEEASQRKPVELYHIWRDGGQHWYYTNGDVAVTYDSQDYVPATLNRGSVQYNSQLEITTLKITAGYLEQPALEFIAINPVEILWISIMRLFRDQDPLEASVIFMGQIKSVSFKGAAAEIECVGFEHFLKMPVPTLRYQLTCNWRLFDSQCGIVKADYKVSATITLDDAGTTLTSATFAGYASGYFTRGHIDFGDYHRAITAHSGDTISIAYPISDLEDDDSVDVYPGCDGRAETCRDTFDNIDNFLGFPFIPEENPAERIS